MKVIGRLSVVWIILMMFAAPVSASELDKKLDDLTVQISAGVIADGQTTIAVMEFFDIQGRRNALGKFIAEELTTRLFKTNKFIVVERELLQKVMEELHLNQDGFMDPSSVQELGRLLGASFIVIGTITDLGKVIKINARMIATETGAINSVAAVEIAKNEALEKLSGGPDSLKVEPAQNEENPSITPAPVEESPIWWDWLGHCNISINYPTASRTMVQMEVQNYASPFNHGDGDVQSNITPCVAPPPQRIPYWILNIRIPFYFQDHLDVNYAVGFQSVQRIFQMDGSSTRILGNCGQIYLSRDVFEKFSVIGAVGLSSYQVPLTHVVSKEFSYYLAMKYYLLSWLFLEGSYAYFPGGVIDKGVLLNSGPITIGSDAVYSIGLGIGL